MKRVMILGAGNCQVPIIKKAKKMGLKTIVVSCEGDYPGFKISDISIKIDVIEKEEILNKAKEYDIDAIFTNQTDIPVNTAAYIAEELKLPGIGTKVASKFTNKFTMRQIANQCGSSIIKHHKAKSLGSIIQASKEMKFPLIIKPVDSQGSRGVLKITKEQELIYNYYKCKAYSSTEEVVLEEYFDGKEITIDGLMIDSNFYNMIIGDVTMFPIANHFIPKSIIYPSVLKCKMREKVHELNRNIVQRMGLPFGLTHAEYRVCENTGEVILLEIAARGGGMYISSDLVPLACGLEVEEILIKQSLGINITDNFQKFERASAFFCPELPCGKLIEIKGIDKASKISGVHRIICNLHNGDKIEPMEDKTSRPVVYLLSGETRKDLFSAYQRLKDTLVFIIESE